MNAAIPPSTFQQCPGVPRIPRWQWRPVLQVYIDAAARDATQEHKKALLLNALGAEGLNRYLRALEDEPQPRTARTTPEDAQDAYKTTLEQLDAIFDTKIAPKFTIQKTLDLAREDERVDHALLPFSGLQVDAISSRPAQDGVGMAATASASSPTGCADTSSPSLLSARAGACYHCGSSQHWANSTACPARSRTCSRCGRHGHFARVCRSATESSAGRQGTSTVTNTVTVLQVDETVNTIGLLRLPVRINNCILSMLIDTGAAVSLLNVQDYKRNFSHIKLLPSQVILQNYTEQPIRTSGYFNAPVSYNGNCVSVRFFVTDNGPSLLGLDATQALKLTIVDKWKTQYTEVFVDKACHQWQLVSTNAHVVSLKSLQVDAISSRPAQDGAGMASTASASSPTGGADTSSPAFPSARAAAST
ncbi:hypothetical protein MTO96_040923 [Rhipicephalus appendiculatus]